jgi:hypothetical protein
MNIKELCYLKFWRRETNEKVKSNQGFRDKPQANKASIEPYLSTNLF